MSSQRNGSKDVVVVIGPGQIGQAIARRIGVGKQVVLADLRLDNANAAADVMSNAGYDVSVTTVDVSSRTSVQALVEKATGFGELTGLIHAAGVSPRVDLYGTALVLEEFGHVIAQGGAGVVIASQIWTSTAAAQRRAKHGTGDDTGGRVAESSISSAR